MPDEENSPELGGPDLHEQIADRLKQYDDKSSLEMVALFLGKTQILEFALKSLLIDKYGFEGEKLEKWTLGITIGELEKQKVRGDYLSLLRRVLEIRNYCAHEILADIALVRGLIGTKGDRLSLKPLRHGAYQMEEALLVFDFLQEHDAWG